MKGLVREEELTKLGITQEELFEKFVEQLLRDFEMSNVLNFLLPITSASYKELHLTINEAIDKIRSQTSLFQQLLYRIDISEKQLKEGLNELNNRSENDIISELIIKRILQKVILKIVYSK